MAVDVLVRSTVTCVPAMMYVWVSMFARAGTNGNVILVLPHTRRCFKPYQLCDKGRVYMWGALCLCTHMLVTCKNVVSCQCARDKVKRVQWTKATTCTSFSHVDEYYAFALHRVSLSLSSLPFLQGHNACVASVQMMNENACNKSDKP